MKIYDGIDNFANISPNKVLLQRGEELLTFREFKKISDNIASYLNERIPCRNKIIIKSDSSINGLLLLIGAAKAGLKSILIDSSYPQEQINKIKADEDIKLIINEEEVFQVINNIGYQEGTIHGLKERKETDIFLGILSSGSTGHPKVIWRDHCSWTSAFENQNEIFGISKDDIFFIGGSLVYSANLNMVLHVLNQGGTIIFADGIFPRSWIRRIKDHKVTGIFLVPANYRILLKNISQPIPNIRVLISTGEKMDLSTLNKIKDNFPDSLFYEYYGASELGHITYAHMDDLILKPNTVGKAFPGVQLKIKDGTIWVNSLYAAPRYKNWATVKDLGYLDDEGFLFLGGREGRIINNGGIKIIPEDIERLIKDLPGVEDVIVIGVEDALKGEVPVAFVERSDLKISASEIASFLKEKVIKSAIPRRIIFIKKIPRNNFGKIHLKFLKSMIK